MFQIRVSEVRKSDRGSICSFKKNATIRCWVAAYVLVILQKILDIIIVTDT